MNGEVEMGFGSKPACRCVATAFCLSCLAVAAPAFGASRYIFSTFTGDALAQEKLRIYTSTDGLNFTLLADTQYGGSTGVLRDPSIMKHTDGRYYIAYTVQSWTTTSSSFAIATSTDLRTWTELTMVPNNLAGASQGYTWAPEWFKDDDGSIHLIVSLSTTTASASFRAYLYTAKDSRLASFSGPTALGIGPNYIDTFVVKVGATYHAFTKDETTKYIEHATASNLTGPWQFVGTADWAGWGTGKEGPALVKLESGQWRLFMDLYGAGGFLYADSSNLNSWSAHSTVPGGLSGLVRHGTILREDLGGTGGSATGGAGTGGTGTGGSSATGGSSTGGVVNRGGNGGALSTGGRATGGTSTTGSSTGGLDSRGGNGGNGASGGSTGTGGTSVPAVGGTSGSGGAYTLAAGGSGTGGTTTANSTTGGATTLGAGGFTVAVTGGSASISGGAGGNVGVPNVAGLDNATGSSGCSCGFVSNSKGSEAGSATALLGVLSLVLKRRRRR